MAHAVLGRGMGTVQDKIRGGRVSQRQTRQLSCLSFEVKGKDCEMNITHVDMVGKYFTEEKIRKTVRLYTELHKCSFIGKAGNPSSTN